MSLRKKPTAMPLPATPPPPAQTDPRTGPSRAHPCSHALSYTFPQSRATEHVQARQHPRVPQTGRYTPNTDMHVQPPKQDPAETTPDSTHAQTLSLSKPPRITALSHTLKLERLWGPSGPTPTNALMRKPRPKQGKALVHDAPPLKETKFIHLLHCVGCTHIFHSLICLTPSLSVVNPFLLQAPVSPHLPSPRPSPNPSLPFHSPCHLPATSHYLMPRI